MKILWRTCNILCFRSVGQYSILLIVHHFSPSVRVLCFCVCVCTVAYPGYGKHGSSHMGATL